MPCSAKYAVRRAILASMMFFCLKLLSQDNDHNMRSGDSRSVSWLDQRTGHWVSELTSEGDTATLPASLTVFSENGSQMIYLQHRDLRILTLSTRQSKLLVPGPLTSVALDPKREKVYFTRPRERKLFATGLGGGKIEVLRELPPAATITSVNSDSKFLAGWFPLSGDESEESDYLSEGNSGTHDRRPGKIFVFDVSKGSVRTIAETDTKPSQISFSPILTELLLYATHDTSEMGSVWTLNINSGAINPVNLTRMTHETAQNPFWAADGKTIWYDLQSPAGEDFYLAGLNVSNRKRIMFSLDRDEWSVHYNVAPGDTAYCGDGSSGSDEAHAKDGMWITMLVPRKPTVSESAEELTDVSTFRSARLVKLEKVDYENVTPNARFTPDHKFIVFTGIHDGQRRILEVEVRHARPTESNTNPLGEF